MVKSSNKTYITRLENPDTGEIIDIWIDVEKITYPDTYDTPGLLEENILNWGVENTNEQPEWVTNQMLTTNLNSIELNEDEDEKDYDDYD